MRRNAASVLTILLPGLLLLSAASAMAAQPSGGPADDLLRRSPGEPQRLAHDRLLDPTDSAPSSVEPGSREGLKAIEARRAEQMARLDELGRIDNCPHSFDVLHYAIDLEINFTTSQIGGSARVQSMSELDGLGQITLDLAVLTVDSVRAGSGPLSFVRHDPYLTIDLERIYDSGETFEVQVFYHGTPGNEGPSGFGGFYFSTTNGGIAYQMGVGLVADPPSMGKYWFPCWDWPCDKATAEFRITVPDGKKAVCNGVLVSQERNKESRSVTYAWSETHQIAPHLMMVAASNYTELVDTTYDWIHYWVYPSQATAAVTHFSNVHTMMDAFVTRYGPYPFSKFGYAAAPKGDMEHQTCVTHVSSVIQPNHTYDWLLAHEMAHQWWGDCVAINDWRDIWLSEGFATYSEAIHREYAYGLANYLAYIQTSLMLPVLTSSENFPIYDPDYLWGTTVYEKGGTVLHMLRHVVGDQPFFDALTLYRSLYEHGNAVTTQFQAAVEAVHGQSLDWFFQEWIYATGWPKYRYAWIGQQQAGQNRLVMGIDQIQTNGPIFTMPVDVKVTTTAGDTLLVLWVDQAHESFDIALHAAPTAVTLDPDNWILNDVQQVSPQAIGDLLPDGCGRPTLRIRPNPSTADVEIALTPAHGGFVRAEIFDASGSCVRRLVDEFRGAGEVCLLWDGCDDAGRALPPGLYFTRVSTTAGTATGRVVLAR